MNILVFGSSGRIGQALASLSNHAVSLDLQINFLDKRKVNLLDREEIVENLATYKPDVVLNLAANVAVNLNFSIPDFSLFSKNLEMLQNLYSACVLAGVDRIVQVGSYHAWSQAIEPPFSSRIPPSGTELNFSSPYAATKSAEVLFFHAREYWTGNSRTKFSLVLLPNIFGPFGPLDPSRSQFIGATIMRLIQAKDSHARKIFAYGNPGEVREYLYIFDAAENLLRFLASGVNQPDFAVVSSGAKFSILDCWNLIAEVIGYEGKVVFKNNLSAHKRDAYFESATFEARPFQTLIQSTVTWYADRLRSSR